MFSQICIKFSVQPVKAIGQSQRLPVSNKVVFFPVLTRINTALEPKRALHEDSCIGISLASNLQQFPVRSSTHAWLHNLAPFQYDIYLINIDYFMVDECVRFLFTSCEMSIKYKENEYKDECRDTEYLILTDD